MTDPKEHLIHWLKDAYAMEHQAIKIAEKQADRIKHYPDVADRIALHAEETKSQAERLKACLEHLGSDTSAFKTGMGKVTGNMQMLAGFVVPDEIVKASIANYVFEHYEIGCYRSLIAAAEKAGEPEIAQVCEDILHEEEEMAEWLEEHLPMTTQKFLQRDAAGMPHKV